MEFISRILRDVLVPIAVGDEPEDGEAGPNEEDPSHVSTRINRSVCNFDYRAGEVDTCS